MGAGRVEDNLNTELNGSQVLPPRHGMTAAPVRVHKQKG
jgi:hypothetical protein